MFLTDGICQARNRYAHEIHGATWLIVDEYDSKAHGHDRTLYTLTEDFAALEEAISNAILTK